MRTKADIDSQVKSFADALGIPDFDRPLPNGYGVSFDANGYPQGSTANIRAYFIESGSRKAWEQFLWQMGREESRKWQDRWTD